MTLNRRQFITTVAAAAVSTRQAAGARPLLDLHQHTNYHKRNDAQLLAHQAQYEVTRTVLLAGAGWMDTIVGGNPSCAAMVARHHGRFVRFACADPSEANAVGVLRENLTGGAIGIGEMKFPVAVDSPEMHRVYALADEMRVPVLIHFEHEKYNMGIERFEAVLKKYPRVNFIGHAQTWWGNVSADLNPTELYPKGPVRRGGLTDRLLSDYGNIYGDLSAGSGLNSLTRDPDFAAGFVDRHHRRLIWGSDCDCHDGRGAGIRSGQCIAASSLTALGKLISDPAKLYRILYQNAADLLALR